MQTDPAAPSLDPLPPPPSPGNDDRPVLDDVAGAIAAAATPIADDAVTAARCPKCTTRASWTGPLTHDMIERTFTRGISSDTGLPLCVRCGTAMELVTVSVIEAAAAQVPPEKISRPIQQALPGTRPPFNLLAALEMIDDQEREASLAEAAWKSKKAAASAARKYADAANEKLRTLIRDLHQRREEYAPDESRSPDGDGHRNSADDGVTTGERDRSVDAKPREDLGVGESSTAGTSGTLRSHTRRGDVAARTAEGHDLAGSTPAGSHQLDETALPTAEEDAQYLHLELEKAGAPHVPVEAILAWTATQRDEAWAWAKAQIHANATADEGRSVSVRWPKHVSQANARSAEPVDKPKALRNPYLPADHPHNLVPHVDVDDPGCPECRPGRPCRAIRVEQEPEPARKPRPRHATPEARQRARQTSSRQDSAPRGRTTVHARAKKGGRR